MGNQGTKNWKLTALFAISLMLIAGLFSNAAIAADGDGMIKVEWGTETNGTFTAADPQSPMGAAATAQALQFTYQAFTDVSNAADEAEEVPGEVDSNDTAINVNGATVQIAIPTGWTVPAANIFVEDGGTRLVLRDTEFGVIGGVALGAVATIVPVSVGPPDVEGIVEETEAAKARARVKTYGDAAKITMIEIELDDNWGSDRDAGGTDVTGNNAARGLVVLFSNVTVAIPRSLAFIDGANTAPYYSYQFATKSMAKGGIDFVRLRPTTINSSPQPHVKVGNIESGKGSVNITPTIAYEGEKYTFDIEFKATGPMYDFTGTDSDIQILFADVDGDGDGLGNIDSELVELRTGSSVRLEASADQFSVDTTNDSITVNISQMNTNDVVRVTYGPVTIGILTAADDTISQDAQGKDTSVSAFTVRTRTSDEDSFTQANDLATGDVKGGRTQAKEGSGTATLSPTIIGAGKAGPITLIYETADTGITDGTLTIIVTGLDPDNPDTEDVVETGDSDGNVILRTASDAYAMVSSPSIPEGASLAIDIDDTNQINWTNLTLEKNMELKTVISNVNVSEMTDNYGWTVTVSGGAGTTAAPVVPQPQLYVIETLAESVEFGSTLIGGLKAGSKATIDFTFTPTGTPVKGGSVSIRLPEGWTSTTDDDAAGQVTAKIENPGADGDFDSDDDPDAVAIDKKYISDGQTITVTMVDLLKAEKLTVTYGAGDNKAVIQSHAQTVEVFGSFQASSTSPVRSAGSVEIDITNVADGAGTATITADDATSETDAQSVRAGSTKNQITATFTAVGTMNGGAVSFQIADGWGTMQRDPLKRNYIDITSSGMLGDVDYGSKIVVAHLEELGPEGTVTFSYGDGSGGRDNEGAEAQRNIGVADFKIKSDGDGDGMFDDVAGSKELTTVLKETNPEGLGEVFTNAKGLLKIDVTAASDGQGTAKREIVKTDRSPSGAKIKYPDPMDPTMTTDDIRIHAGSGGNYLKFTYTPEQTIEDGLLRFTVATGWIKPQGGNQGVAGYTRVEGGEPAMFPDADTDMYVDVPIVLLNKAATIVIHYGDYPFEGSAGGAQAPGIANPNSTFMIAIKGSKNGDLEPLRDHRDTMLSVPVYTQASGGGTAMVEVTDADDKGDLNAGDMERELTITYTATGEIQEGMLKLTVPDTWTDPMASNVDVSINGVSAMVDSKMFGGYYTAMEMAIPTDLALTKRDVIVDVPELDGSETVVFVYTTTVQTTDATDVAFGVSFKGKDGPGTDDNPGIDFIPLMNDNLKVDVGEAAAGSGTAMVMPGAVTAGMTVEKITFTYTVAGDATYPTDIRVEVPSDWSDPTAEAAGDDNYGTYKVTHRNKDGRDLGTTKVTELAPIEDENGVWSMAARIKAGPVSVAADETIEFEYQNVVVPDMPGMRAPFTIRFDQEQIDSDVSVLILSAEEATQLMVDAPDETMVDTPVMVTIMLQDAAGTEAGAPMGGLEVALSGSDTGMFSMTDADDATAIEMVTISAGSNSETVYYSDSTAGEATLTASAGDLSGDDMIMVTGVEEVPEVPEVPEMDEITSVTFMIADSDGNMKAAAMDGDMITVTALGTPLKMATVEISNEMNFIVTGGGTDMMESTETPGTYTYSHPPLAMGTPDGMYDVTVNLGNAEPMMAAMQLMVDNTAPMELTALVDMMTAKSGTEVTITAMVEGATSVSADASGLNADASMLKLMMDADSEGMYIGSVMVTAEGDEEVTITVTAMDDAGNEADPDTVMVTLDNTAPMITGPSADMMNVMAGDTVVISAMVEGATSVSADASALNADAAMVPLTDADGDGMYESEGVMVTADSDGEVEITIMATDDAGNSAMESVPVTLDNTAPTVGEVAATTPVKTGAMVTVSAMVTGATKVYADASALNADAAMLALMDADGDGMYSDSVMVTADGDGEQTITIRAMDDAGNSVMGSAMVTLDNTMPEVTEVSVSPSPASNGDKVTITAMLSEMASVSANVSMLDTMQTAMVDLMDADGDGMYSGSFTISEENEADNGSKEVTVTAMDAAGNSGEGIGSVDLVNPLDYTSMIPQGISLFHVPLDVTAIDGEAATLSMVSDLYNALGDAVNYLITYDGGWNSYLGDESGDMAITADLGIVAVMRAEKMITFTGYAWDEGMSMINLMSDLNLVGLPVNDPSVSMVSDIMNLPEFAGKVTSIIVSTDDNTFVTVAAAGDAGDGEVRGDAAYIVNASAEASQMVTGEGWSNGEMTGAAPIALFGHKVDNQTPALFVEGSIVDELTGLAKEGFRIKVKNLSTKAALSDVSQGDMAEGGYNMTFVDTAKAHAARVGDVLEISANSPDPLIGVKPVRHIVTIDDVKNSRIELTDLIAYEIPAETELLRNYPNPFNPETWIPYRLAEDADVSLTIYDVNGELVRSIDVGHQSAAVYETRAKAIYWDGRNRFGEQVASGIYFYNLSAGDFSATRKMVILK